MAVDAFPGVASVRNARVKKKKVHASGPNLDSSFKVCKLVIRELNIDAGAPFTGRSHNGIHPRHKIFLRHTT